jgi:hypothetical protein
MKSLRTNGMQEDLAVRGWETCGRISGGVGDPRRTEIKIKNKIKSKSGKGYAVRRGVTRLREKNLANMADKKKTLEITGLFCMVLVRHLADKKRMLEIRGRRPVVRRRRAE